VKIVGHKGASKSTLDNVGGNGDWNLGDETCKRTIHPGWSITYNETCCIDVDPRQASQDLRTAEHQCCTNNFHQDVSIRIFLCRVKGYSHILTTHPKKV
jgi:hypothetical protein